jgi:Holliday junction DNA helicase RuvA
MIRTLSGILLEKALDPVTGDAHLLIETGGVGFGCLTTERSMVKLPAVGEPVKVHTQILFKPDRPDGLMLVAFATPAEREVFGLLQGASGVGPKMALALLSALSVPELIEAVLADAPKVLTVAKGVGSKAAQKIVLDIREKIKARQALLLHEVPQRSAALATSIGHALLPQAIRDDCAAVLATLGYTPGEIEAGLLAVASQLDMTDSEHSSDSRALSEAVLRETLRWLAKR